MMLATPGFGITPLVPAYGRDYSTVAQVKEAWLAEKDFETPTGQYINRQQFLAGSQVPIRYHQLRRVVFMVA